MDSASTFFKRRLKELRKARGWSQEKAAEECGIPYKVYQFYEVGLKTNPTLTTLEKISKGFSLELQDFFSGKLKQHNKKID